jgi:hypothetical protein
MKEGGERRRKGGREEEETRKRNGFRIMRSDDINPFLGNLIFQ